MNAYKQAVFDLFTTCYDHPPSEEEDRTWHAWLTHQHPGRDLSDVKQLLAMDVRDVFKARCMTVLLAPNKASIPFEWIDKYAGSHWSVDVHSGAFDAFSDALQRFTAQLLCLNIDRVHAGGLKESDLQAAITYNFLIVGFLSRLSESDPVAQELFRRFSIRDLHVFEDLDTLSGYRPLESLLHHPNVSEHWKRLADLRMQGIILSEDAGTTTARVSWEHALSCYLELIQLPLHTATSRHSYSNRLFATQIKFLLSRASTTQKVVFHAWLVKAILERLGADEIEDLRHQFVRHIILNRPDTFEGFSVYDEDSRAAAQLMKELFSDDLELMQALDQLIQEGERRAEEEFCARKQALSDQKALLDQMR